MNINWDEKFSVKIELFDKHHKKLVSLLNFLYDMLNSHIDIETIDVIFDELVDYVKYHFSEEEKLMYKYNYPGLTIHKKEHLKFVDFIIDRKLSLADTGYLLGAIELFDFLREWLIKHISITDMRYAKFFNDKGVY